MKIDIANVVNVYSGKAGACACGCAGKYTYASKYRGLAAKRRGYAIDDKDVDDTTVASIVKKLERSQDVKLEEGLGDEWLYHTTVGKRTYVAFLKGKPVEPVALEAVPVGALCAVKFVDRNGTTHWVKVEGSYAACLTRDSLIASGYSACAFHGASLIL
jgi:hypothetical protein